MTERIIMCREQPVLSYPVDDGGACVASGTVLDRDRLPLELIEHGTIAVYAKRINAWWTHRAIPPTRDGLSRALDALGSASRMGLLEQSHGLSLSDQYWVRYTDDDIRWSDINYFHHTFDESVGHAMLTLRSSSHHFSFNAPDSSTGGDLPKRWMVGTNGERLLIKAGRTGQEPLNELMASRLARRLGIAAVDYMLGEEDNKPVSVCRNMLDDDEELIAAWPILEAARKNNRLSARDTWTHAAHSLGVSSQAIEEATDDWLLIDWLMRNTDRHYNNFGLIRNVRTLEIRPAPIFDTGTSLWCGELRIDSADYRALPFFSAHKFPTAHRHVRLIRNWERYDLEALRSWPDEVMQYLTQYGVLSPQRIDSIGQALEARIHYAQNVRDHAASRTYLRSDRQNRRQ